jgi:hypothetical protein
VGAGRERTGAAGGHAAVALSATASVVNGADALGPAFMLGLLRTLVGSLVVASAPGGQARPLGGALALGLVASMAVGTGGAAVLALAWFAASTPLRGPAPVLAKAGA